MYNYLKIADGNYNFLLEIQRKLRSVPYERLYVYNKENDIFEIYLNLPPEIKPVDTNV